ncbi:hypothetical protein [Ferrimonas senticii]|uniref:hypothetical protein n=1 Tax=Ferrimonas senticii TaxID=394566 RepID=UPI0004200860|nr:hypothetical protein [Ferrimonas senticii]
MALPLILLAAGAAAALEYRSHRKTQLRQRYQSQVSGDMALSPSEWLPGHFQVTPALGSIVVCYVYGVVEHSGLWLGDDCIAELHGSGLVRGISAKRFLTGRSGGTIFVGCDRYHSPLARPEAVERAAQQLFSYRDYHLRDNNCHQFVWQCLTGEQRRIASFKEFNRLLAGHFDSPLYWDPLNVAVCGSLEQRSR